MDPTKLLKPLTTGDNQIKVLNVMVTLNETHVDFHPLDEHKVFSIAVNHSKTELEVSASNELLLFFYC